MIENNFDFIVAYSPDGLEFEIYSNRHIPCNIFYLHIFKVQPVKIGILALTYTPQ